VASILTLDSNLPLGIAAKPGHVLLLPESLKKNGMIFTIDRLSNPLNFHSARNSILLFRLIAGTI